MTFRSTLTAIAFGSLALVVACSSSTPTADPVPPETTQPFVTVLGVAQDGGSPHIGCEKSCCLALCDRPEQSRRVVFLGLVAPVTGERWLVEATPDLPDQLHALLAVAAGPRPDKSVIAVTSGLLMRFNRVRFYLKECSLIAAIGAWSSIRVKTTISPAKFTTSYGPKILSLGSLNSLTCSTGDRSF